MYDSFENMAAVQVVKLITAAKCLHNGGPFLVSLASPPVHRMVLSMYDEVRDPDLNTTLLRMSRPMRLGQPCRQRTVAQGMPTVNPRAKKLWGELEGGRR